MAPVKLPDGVDGERARPGAGDASTWVRRAILTCMAVFVVLGLINTFGQRPTTTQAQTPAATLRVTAPTDVRGGLIFQVRVDITAGRTLTKPALVFSPGWWESMTTNAIAPQPTNQTSLDGSPVFALSPIRAGRHATYWFYFQVNPTNVGWERPEVLQLEDNGLPVATIRRTITIYP
jgi:hypothetical protein